MKTSDRYEEKMMQGKCRDMMRQYSDVLALLQEEILEEVSRERINGDTSFEYAKRYIRNEAIREGIKIFIGKITSKANVQD